MDFRGTSREDLGAARDDMRSAARALSSIELPPPDTKRWVVRRKAAVVAAVREGVISLDEACRRYNLSVEEFIAWQRTIERHGVRGLRVTRLKDYSGSSAEAGA